MSRLYFLTALLSAALFGAATPASKALLPSLGPYYLAGFLYLGAAAGVFGKVWREGNFYWPWRMDSKTAFFLGGAILLGGIAGPVLLLFGLRMASAASVSLWLVLELVATALLGIVFFNDHLTARGWISFLGMFLAAILLSFHEGAAGLKAGLLVTAACFCWGADNHFTALIKRMSPSQTTIYKGVVAGLVNLAIGSLMAPSFPEVDKALAAMLIGVFSHGISIVLYISSAQRMGATRSQIIFSSSPFFGVALSALFLDEPLSGMQLISGGMIVFSLGLLFFDQHSHRHHHEAKKHDHWHRHDDDLHQHVEPGLQHGLFHSHEHSHESTTHKHPHWPDQEHRHDH